MSSDPRQTGFTARDPWPVCPGDAQVGPVRGGPSVQTSRYFIL